MIDAIKQLREETGAPLGDIRNALSESGNDLEGARKLLRERYGAIAEKKASREVRAGIIEAYIHGGRVGAMVALQCETDFVARNPEFKAVARELAMQLAAMPAENSVAFTEQQYIRDPSRTVRDIVAEAIGKFGENIKIGRFARIDLTES